MPVETLLYICGLYSITCVAIILLLDIGTYNRIIIAMRSIKRVIMSIMRDILGKF